MEILILDIYKEVDYRVSKDTSGGYGTANNFGDDLFTVFLKKKLKKIDHWPSVSCAYVFSVLKSKGHNVEYSKKVNHNYDKYDFIIVTSSIVCCETELKAITEVKKKSNRIFAIGPFATNNPKLYNSAGATVILGEPEFYFLSNFNFIEDSKKDIISFKHEFQLDDLPYPCWDEMLLDLKLISKLFGNQMSVPILATRGCPFSCFKYCVYPLQQGRKVRQRSPVKIVEEISYWHKKGVNNFIFRDPVFSINRKHTVEFCNELIAKNLKLNFLIETHLKILDSEIIKLLKKAGLKVAKVGVESEDVDVLKKSGRYTESKDEQYLKIRELEDNGIKVSAMYIIGFPDDDKNTINKTIQYAKKLNTFYAQFSVWTPYPGTPVFDEYKDSIIVKDFESYDQYSLVYKHRLFDQNQVKHFLSKAYSKYYLRLKWIIKYFKFRFFYAQQ